MLALQFVLQDNLQFDDIKFSDKDEIPQFEVVCVIKNTNRILEIQRNCSYLSFDDDSILAIANISLELNKTGWTYLDVYANPDAPPMWQMRAIGYLEGNLWYQQLYDHNTNLQAWYLYDYLAPYTEFPEEIYQFYKANLKYLQENSQNNNDRYWNQVSYTLSHFYGLVQGYQQATSSNPEMYLSELDLFIYMASGDLLDVSSFAVSTLRNRPEELHDLKITDHCSGLVKITDTDVFAGQSAWFFLTAMIRVRKHYHFDLETNVTSVLFSSYPGFSYSFDDFAITQDLVYLETTNDIYDSQLYDLCSYNSVPAFIRSQVAGRLSESSPNNFVIEISKYNSGTYNNQWIAINNNRSEIYVLEQIPGLCAIYNATERLQNDKYFPSYNIPSMEEVWQVSGYAKHAATNSTDRYNTNPRANIFRRDQGQITDLDGFKEIMRYNDYLEDPYSQTENGPEPGNAIAARYDLRTDDTVRCFGCFSTSVSHYNKTSGQYENSFISSPPYEDVPPFVIQDAVNQGLFCPSQGLIVDEIYEHDFVNSEFLQ